jgi:flagellar protein FliS
MHQDVHKAYHRATHTVAKTQQVVMLYEGALRNLKHAQDAMVAGDATTRFQKLVRAGDIIMGLQSSIDFESGGEVAKVLYNFYSAIDARILSLLNVNNPQIVEQIMQELREMRDVWAEIDKNNGENAAPVATSPVAASNQNTATGNPFTVSA